MLLKDFLYPADVGQVKKQRVFTLKEQCISIHCPCFS